MAKKALVTGTAGFIGYHLAERLLKEGWQVVGYDNVNDYYDVNLKNARIERLNGKEGYSFVRADLENREVMNEVFDAHDFDVVVNLAAQAGVRYSIENPMAYIDSNIVGFTNILEACRHHKTDHLIYASSSSVYGANTTIPWSAHHGVNHPMSLYAATKKANELMAHTYSNLYGLPTTGLRFFTVYGPWGRPDMALFIFTKNILEGKPIKVFNHGDMSRDFTYVDDIVESIVRLINRGPAKADPNWSGKEPDPCSSYCPYAVYNIGNNSPVNLVDFIDAIEETTGKKAIRELVGMQPGDVPKTYADASDLIRDVGFKPNTDVKDGIKRFVQWYREFYNI